MFEKCQNQNKCIYVRFIIFDTIGFTTKHRYTPKFRLCRPLSLTRDKTK